MDNPGLNTSRIVELPAPVANQIAAGEVVERPANVVKELVENALDAGAGHVSVTVEGAGLKLISVRDDGCGMSRVDAVKCLRQHATSKIRTAEDIQAIGSFGFRGEAIPSIASVSRFRLVTSNGGEEGTEVLVDCGGEPVVRTAGTPKGTWVEVRDLFCNQPARLKFLKSRTTEEGQIRRIFNVYALANPGVAFSLTVDGRSVVQLPANGTLRERLFALEGEELCSTFVEVDAQLGGVSLKGVVQHPSSCGQIRQEQLVFVNGRPATAPVIMAAMREALGDGVTRGRPFACLNLSLPPTEVDVNVHPTKREVRFRHTRNIHQIFTWGISESLRPKTLPQPIRYADDGPVETLEAGEPSPQPVERQTIPEMRLPDPQLPMPVSPTPFPRDGRGMGVVRVIGQAENGYVIAENTTGILVIDPGAALERITYEKLVDGGFAVQPLLIPQIVDVPPGQSPCLVMAKEELGRLGFELDELSPGKWKVDAVPALAKDVGLAELLSELASALSMEGRGLAPGVMAERLARGIAKVCGRKMPRGTKEMLQTLVDELSETSQPYLRPSDKTRTMYFLLFAEVTRKLGR